MMWKLLILQRIYNVSDDQTEYQINDRLSFQRFLGLTTSDKVPDAKTIWGFRDALVKAEVIEFLFQLFYQELEARGIVAREGSINDAKWTKKGDVSYFGYKNHVKADAKSKVISDYDVTPANTHDSQVFTQFYNEYENDSAYVGQNLPRNVVPEICERAYRNKPLTDGQKAANREKSRVRARIEHVFGFIEGHMHGSTFRGKGLARAKFNIGLTNLIYNVERYVFFRRKGLCAG
jgi:IS5 family transposase